MVKATTTTTSKQSLEIHFVIFALLLVFATWSILLRLYPDFSLTSGSFKLFKPSTKSFTSKANNDHAYLKKLMEETSILLNEISEMNVTGLGMKLESERDKVHADLRRLQKQITIADDKLGDCLNDHKDLTTKVNSLEKLSHEKDLQISELNHQLSSALTKSSNSHKLLTDTNSVVHVGNHSVTDGLLQSSTHSYWLIVGIPTISRHNAEDYLLKSLASIATQLPTSPSSLFYHRILIVVVNIEGSTHTRFYEAENLYSPISNPNLAPYFRFLTLDKTVDPDMPDPKVGATAENDLGNANVPGYKVRKQSRDIVRVLQKTLQVTDNASELHQYYLFLEDDMLFCPYGFEAIQYLLEKSTLYHGDWLAIRASYGMNGIFMHYKDIRVFSEYLLKNQIRRPPDHLVVEWFAGETPDSKAYKGSRVNIGFRYNLFDHIGRKSTLRPAEQIAFPRCYDPLMEPTVFKVEAFDPIQCHRDDIWPCDVPHRVNQRIKWDQLD